MVKSLPGSKSVHAAGAKAKKRAAGDLPHVAVKSRAEWRKWLSANYGRATGIWLVTFKKAASPEHYLSYADIVEEALCFGWVDSLPRALDAERSMRLVSPRKPGSSWSAVNKARVEKLMTAHLMAAPGLAVVEKAKEDGSWKRLDTVEALQVPKDLGRALRQFEKASDNFNAFPRSSKRLILEWIGSAKRPETRTQRIEETARLAAANQRANHFRQP